MALKSLQDFVDSVPSVAEYLRNANVGPYTFPVVPNEFSNWRAEQRAWREGVALSDQSYHMVSLEVTGPDALKLIKLISINGFENFEPNKGKQLIVCNEDGFLIGDLVLFYEGPEEFLILARPPAMNWLRYIAERESFKVDTKMTERCPYYEAGRAVIDRKHYRYHIQGPNAPELFERLHGGPLPKIRFFNIGDINVGSHRARALRHSMAGGPGLEIWGPFEEATEVLHTILEAGKDLGLKQVGTKAYGTTNVESYWVPAPIAAVYTGEKLKPYREWLPANTYECFNSIGGSFTSNNIEDYYSTPYDFGYDTFLKFDHDYIGREALEVMDPAGQRRRATFVWDPEDFSRIVSSVTGGGETYKFLDLPMASYSVSHFDKVMRNGEVAGRSNWNAFSYNERVMLSIGSVDRSVEDGDILELVWGEENGGTIKPTVEPHVQTTVKVRVATPPYVKDALANRAR